MLHGTYIFRYAGLTLLVVLGLLGALLLPSAAHATPRGRGTGSSGGAQLVRLVQTPEGDLRVVRGATLPRALRGTVIAEERDVLLRTTDVVEVVVDDPRRAEQWGLDVVGAESVWGRADGNGQVIAVIDSGIDGRHPDLRDRLVEGFSSVGGDPTVDLHGHGTHVAGTAGAEAGDAYGVVGLAHGASLMPVQVTDERGVAYASHVAEGLLWAVEHGATIANLSLAGTQPSSVLNAAIDHAVTEGVVVVVAAGNEFGNGNPETWPAAHEHVVAVGAAVDERSRATFSTTGAFVDVLAPGSAILSDRPDSRFGYASGTSMASPLVAGAIAVLRSAAPDATVDEVLAALYDAAQDLGRRGRDDEHGHGLIDVGAALDALAVPSTTAPDVAALPDAAPAPVGTDFAVGGGTSPVPTPPVAGAAAPAQQGLDDDAWLAQGFGQG